jgi:hypothetical protein
VRRWIGIVITGLATAALLLAVTLNGSLNVLGTLTANVVDFSGAASTAPMKAGTTLPPACSVGQAFFKSDAPAGQNIYLCTASNTWSQVSGGGATFDWKPSTRYVVFRTEFPGFWNQGSPAYFGDVILNRVVGTQSLNNPAYGSDGLHHGVATISTTSTSGNRSAWFFNSSYAAAGDAESLFALSSSPWEFVVVFRYPNSTDFANSSFYVGMMDDTSSNPPAGVAVRYIAGTDSGFMFATAAANAWGETLSSGVTPDTNWHRFRIRSDGAVANKIWFQLDNGPEYSGCPSGCNLTVSAYQSSAWSGVFYVSLTTNEAAQKAAQLDYLHLWRDLGSER